MVRYEVKGHKFSSHSVVLQEVGEGGGRKLLDVGCADGQMSERFADQGWNVFGIEPHSTDAVRARERGIAVMQLSLEEALDELGGKFSAIILADVLEHFSDPWTQLERLTQLLEPDGLVIISIPNIAHLVPRARLLAGKFEYEERGIMDRTHLRFFTRGSALTMVTESGLDCVKLIVTPTPLELVFPKILNSPLGRRTLSINARLSRAAPKLFGYQFVMVCRSKNYE